MRTLGSSSARYRFSSFTVGGRPWEIPYVKITENDEIPALNKAQCISVDFLNTNDLSDSNLHIQWAVNEKHCLSMHASAQDIRLKQQYAQQPETFGIIVDLLLKSQDSGKNQSRDFGETVALGDLSEVLKFAVKQVSVWAAFMDEHKNMLRCSNSFVTEEAYFAVGITSEALYITPAEEEMFAEGMFTFDPVKEPPTVTDEQVYWELADKKVLVVLPHSHSSEKVAVRYNYSPAFQKYHEKKKKNQREQDDWNQAREQRAKQAKSEIENHLRQRLLK